MFRSPNWKIKWTNFVYNPRVSTNPPKKLYYSPLKTLQGYDQRLYWGGNNPMQKFLYKQDLQLKFIDLEKFRAKVNPGS